MKTLLTALLAASLAINAALLFIATSGARLHEAPPARAASPVPSSIAPKLDRGIWSTLNSDDLPTLVARLRRAGFPPEAIRELVTARIDETFAARRRALDPDTDSQPFWKTKYIDQKLQAALNQLNRERRKVLRDLLGPEADASSGFARARWRREFAYLPPAQAAQVRQIAERYSDLRDEVSATSMAPADTSARRLALIREERAAFAQILSPEELEQYELRTSGSARTIRSWIDAFDASESEFLAIYRPMHEVELRFPSSSDLSPAETKEREAAYQRMNDQIKTALGPDRFAEFDRSRNPSYQRTAQLVTRLELPPATANQVWALANEVQQRSATIRADPTTPAAERDASLTALATEATEKVTAALGPRGLEAYKQYGGGWLTTLSPRPVTKP